MNWKSIISIIALLLTGFVAGFFTNRYLAKQIIQDVANRRHPKAMEQRLYKILALEGDQKTTLAPIIQQHFEEMATFSKENRLKRDAMNKKFNEAITPTLTATQKERLEAFQKRFKRTFGRKNKRKGEQHRKRKDK